MPSFRSPGPPAASRPNPQVCAEWTCCFLVDLEVSSSEAQCSSAQSLCLTCWCDFSCGWPRKGVWVLGLGRCDPHTPALPLTNLGTQTSHSTFSSRFFISFISAKRGIRMFSRLVPGT